jgi:zinc protease
VELLAYILGKGANSRLYQALVVDKGLAVNAGASYNSTSLDTTRMSVSATPKPGVGLAQLEGAIDAVLAEISDKGVTAEELERAKNRMVADAIYAQDNHRTLAHWYGAALTSGSTIDQVREWPVRIRAVTPEAVRAAARQWLDKRRSVTGYLVKDLHTQEKRS